jgi:hypothetical protein
MPPASTANSSDQTVIGASGTLYIGTPGATITAPTDEDTAVDTDLVQVGFLTEDGVTFRDGKEVGSLRAWQTPYDVRRFVTGRMFELEFSLMQWNWHTVPFAFGGGTLTEPTAGEYKYVPPDGADLDERALVLDWLDGTEIHRLWVPRGIVIDAVEVTIKRDEAAVLPIKFGAIFDGTNDPWTYFTDSTAFDVA